MADVHMCFVDTNPHVTSYRKYDWFNRPGGLEQQVRSAESDKLKLMSTLQGSDAQWKLVWTSPDDSNGFWRDGVRMSKCIEVAIMQGGTAAYFNGHDHDLQHTKGRNCGCQLQWSNRCPEAAAPFHIGHRIKTGRGFGTSETEFEYDGAGFASVRVSHDRMRSSSGASPQGAEGLLYTVVISPILGC